MRCGLVVCDKEAAFLLSLQPFCTCGYSCFRHSASPLLSLPPLPPSLLSPPSSPLGTKPIQVVPSRIYTYLVGVTNYVVTMMPIYTGGIGLLRGSGSRPCMYSTYVHSTHTHIYINIYIYISSFFQTRGR